MRNPLELGEFTLTVESDGVKIDLDVRENKTISFGVVENLFGATMLETRTFTTKEFIKFLETAK